MHNLDPRDRSLAKDEGAYAPELGHEVASPAPSRSHSHAPGPEPGANPSPFLSPTAHRGPRGSGIDVPGTLRGRTDLLYTRRVDRPTQELGSLVSKGDRR